MLTTIQIRTFVFACLMAVLSAAGAVAQENWTRFRGSDATGVVPDDPRLPEVWDQETGVLWQTDIPGRGWGSPIVWGDRVFVSAVHSDADYEAPKAGLYLGQGRGEPPDSVHHWMVYCLSLDSGELLWKHEAHTGKPDVPRHPKNTYAAETPTTDGQRLYVLFGDVGLYAYDFDGKPLWTHSIEPKKTFFGYGAAASPVVQDDQVIMVYDNLEESYIAAFDSATGEPRWKVLRDEKKSWSTPLVWRHDGRTEIVTTGEKENRSYSPEGELLWHFDGKMSVLTIPSPLAADGLLYITSGYFQDQKRPIYAIRPGASGDISLAEGETSNDSIVWSRKRWGRITRLQSCIAAITTHCSTAACSLATMPRPANSSSIAPASRRGPPSPLHPGPTTASCSSSTRTAPPTSCPPAPNSASSAPTRSTSSAWPPRPSAKASC